MNKPNKPTAFITRSADRLTPRMYYAWVEYNGKEFEVGRYMTRYGALRGAVRYARELFAHEQAHGLIKRRIIEDNQPTVWDVGPLPEVDAADIKGLPYVEDGETKFSFLDTVKDAGGKSQYVSGLQKLDDGELMY